MEKVIRLRYRGFCRKCRKPIQAGNSAVWLGKGRGVRHTYCFDDSPQKPEQLKPLPSDPVFRIDFKSLREIYLRVAKGNVNDFNRLNNKDKAGTYQQRWKKRDFYGATSDEMRRWLENGYPVQGLDVFPSDLVPKRKRRRIVFTEDGEMQLDLVLAGFDYPFLEWEKRPTKPGMSCVFETAFSAITQSEVIAEYQVWIARALQTLEINGYDLEVSVSLPASEVWNRGGKVGIEIIVKRENEASDFASWSAMFSPGGFRHLGFTALMLTADHFDRDVRGDLGIPESFGEWKVTYDEETRILHTGVPRHPHSFPEREMTDQLNAIIGKEHH
jgi:hypothetical protein